MNKLDKWWRQYQKGASLKRIARDEGVSYETVRMAFINAGFQLRGNNDIKIQKTAEKQTRALSFIADYRAKCGLSPSLEEIGKHVYGREGYATDVKNIIVKPLLSAGLLSQVPGQPRSLQVVVKKDAK